MTAEVWDTVGGHFSCHFIFSNRVLQGYRKNQQIAMPSGA
jgi:hypothetical protein